MESNHDYKINKYFLLSIIIIFGLLLFYSLREFFTAFLGAVMFYVLSKPLMERLTQKYRWKKSLAAACVIFLSFLIILCPLFLIGSLLYNEVASLALNPDAVIQPLKELNLVILQKFNINILSPESIGKLQAITTQSVSIILNSSLSFFSSITMMYFFMYFLLVNINRLEAAIVFYLPFKRTTTELFGKELVAQTISNALGMPLIAVIHGLLAYIAYKISGLPEAGFWAVLTGFASIIPIVGTALIWAPVAAYLFAITQTNYGIFVIIWGIVVIGLSDNLIRFMLAKKMADVHPIITVLGIIMGLNYFGFTGLIFGPLLISYFFILLKIYFNQYQKPGLVKKKTTKNRLGKFNFSLGNKK